jgi:phosphatidylinositol glycan class N
MLLASVILLFLAPEFRNMFVSRFVEVPNLFPRIQVQIGLILLSCYLVWSTEWSLFNRTGLPFVNQVLAWSLFGYSLISIMFISESAHYYDLFLAIASSLAIPFILLSISYEVLFFVSLTVMLLAWIALERATRPEEKSPIYIATNVRAMDSRDMGAALLYMLFCWIAFFGTGNVVSISSFQISSTYRFVTVFRPFLMTTIIIVKIMIPFVLVSIAFAIVTQIRKTPLTGSFFSVVAVTDIMSLNHFFFVRDSGSWKEIGVSIFHFAGVNGFIILHILLFGFAQMILRHGITTTTEEDAKSPELKRKEY